MAPSGQYQAYVPGEWTYSCAVGCTSRFSWERRGVAEALAREHTLKKGKGHVTLTAQVAHPGDLRASQGARA